MNFASQSHRASRPPLCESYRSVRFETLLAAVRGPQGCASLPLTWGLGVSSNARWEVLGAWPTLDASDASSIPAEFRARGLAYIDCLIFEASIDGGSGMLDAFPSARRLTPQFLIDEMWSLSALPKRTRECVREGEAAAGMLRKKLRNALDRRGSFKSLEASAKFVESWLLDAEDAARRQRLAAVRRSELAGLVAPRGALVLR